MQLISLPQIKSNQMSLPVLQRNVNTDNGFTLSSAANNIIDQSLFHQKNIMLSPLQFTGNINATGLEKQPEIRNTIRQLLEDDTFFETVYSDQEDVSLEIKQAREQVQTTFAQSMITSNPAFVEKLTRFISQKTEAFLSEPKNLEGKTPQEIETFHLIKNMTQLATGDFDSVVEKFKKEFQESLNPKLKEHSDPIVFRANPFNFYTDCSKRDKAESIVNQSSFAAAAAAAIPVPGASVPILTGITAQMTERIANVYGLTDRDSIEALHMASQISGAILGPALAEGIKAIPGLGTVVGSSAAGISAYCHHQATGRLLMGFMEDIANLHNGPLDSFSKDELSVLWEGFQKGGLSGIRRVLVGTVTEPAQDAFGKSFAKTLAEEVKLEKLGKMSL